MRSPIGMYSWQQQERLLRMESSHTEVVSRTRP